MIQTVLDFIADRAAAHPEKLAILHGAERVTYAQLAAAMREGLPLPIPLLGESWTGNFHLRTTGTTGAPKTVVVSQCAVIANTENLIAAQGFCADTTFIITGAIDHLGSWSKIFPTLFQGGTLIILDGMKDIDAFYNALDFPSDKLATFLVPANIRILLQFSAERLSTYSNRIDFIETGAAPISHDDMLALCRLLPHTRLFNTYASTETGVVATYNFNDGATLTGCCGRALRHSRIIITPDGKIACQGPTLMSGYLDDDEQTREMLRPDENGIPTLYTHDNGRIDENGCLHILGRSDDIINVGGLKVAPSEVEVAALAHPCVKDCICVAVPHSISGSALKLLVVLETGTTFNKRDLARFLAGHLERHKVPMLYETVEKVERNTNGKLNRNFYRH